MKSIGSVPVLLTAKEDVLSGWITATRASAGVRMLVLSCMVPPRTKMLFVRKKIYKLTGSSVNVFLTFVLRRRGLVRAG